MSKKTINIYKATDGLVDNPKNTKPRYYASIEQDNDYHAISKLSTHNSNKPEHVSKMKKGLRKSISGMNGKTVIDKTLYTEKSNKNLIHTSDLKKTNLVYKDKEADDMYGFVMSDKKNMNRYLRWINKVKKKKKE